MSFALAPTPRQPAGSRCAGRTGELARSAPEIALRLVKEEGSGGRLRHLTAQEHRTSPQEPRLRQPLVRVVGAEDKQKTNRGAHQSECMGEVRRIEQAAWR